MKVEIVLVYVLQAIFISECRLRKSDSSKIPVERVEDRVFADQYLDNNYKKKPVKDERLQEQLRHEQAAGSFADALAPNEHYSVSTVFQSLGRRFVPQYPYYEKKKQELADNDAEEYLHKVIQDSKANYEKEDQKLLPVKASPELVLKVARESKLLAESKQPNPADELINKQILRSGDYWNGVWKEEVEPSILRAGHEKLTSKAKVVPLPKLGAVRAKIMPGTKLYQLISLLKPMSPRFLYVMNVD